MKSVSIGLPMNLMANHTYSERLGVLEEKEHLIKNSSHRGNFITGHGHAPL